MTEVNIHAQDNSGSFSGYLALPAAVQTGAGHAQIKAPGVILIQEIFGVNANMRAWCDHYAKLGFVALCPDLFWRQKPGVQLTDKTEAEWKQAFAYLQGFNIDKGVEDLDSAQAYLRQHPACTGKVGNIGFCLGGRLATLMATRTSADASVSYYGVGLENQVGEFPNIKKPLLLHVAELDKYTPPEAREILRLAVEKTPLATLHVYQGMDHAFARIGGEHYNAEAAQLANERTLTFLNNHLAS